MRKVLRLYLTYSRRERQAVFAFICLIVLFQSAAALLRYWPKDYSHEPPFSLTELAEIEQILDSEEEPSILALNYFDPNKATQEELVQKGFPEWLANRTIKFRSKGGSFNGVADLKKIYGMPDSLYESIKDYVVIEEKNAVGKSNNSAFAKAKPVKETRKALTVSEAFNPNTISEKDLRQMGIPNKVVKNWINYREKGGQFWNEESVARIYGLNEELLSQLKPYLKFDEKPKFAAKSPNSNHSEYKSKSKKSVTISINKASKEQWMELHGIGLAYAGRIIKFRDKLGGFCKVEQVAMTYGLPDSVFQKIQSNLKLNESPKTIDLNTASVEELKEHPFITWKMANQLDAYRNQHPPFKSVEEVYKMEGQWTSERIQKLDCYLSFGG